MVALDWNRFVSVLIQRSGPLRSPRTVPPLGVGQRQPVHESRHFVGLRPQYQMPMIRHHAITEKPGRYARKRLGKHIFKRTIVAVMAKNAYTPDGAIQDMKNQPSRLVQRSMRHDPIGRTSKIDALPETLAPEANDVSAQ